MGLTALVTGGSGDIGRAVAEALIAAGHETTVLDLDPEATRRVAGEIGARALIVDISDESAVENALAGFEDGPDVLANVAGIGRFGSLLDISLEDFRRTLDVNLTGAFIVSRAAARGMVRRGRGAIVNVTSINAIATGPGSGAYPASKAGLAKLTELMALEWGPSGVRVNAVAPGFIDAGISTPFYADPEVRALRRGAVPSRRLGVSEDVAGAVAWLASDAASYVNGHQLVVDGGVSVSLLTQLPRSKPS